MVKRPILLCATACGGARNLIPLTRTIRAMGLEYSLLGSSVTASFFDGDGSKVEMPRFADTREASEYLASKNPLAVICGAAGQDCAEKFIIAAAKKISVTSLVVLDEWFNYRMRFSDKNNDLAYLPDIVCCQDGESKEGAASEGIPAGLLHITGSPALAWLVDEAQEFAAHPPPMPDIVKTTDNIPVVTFLSETHAADYGSVPGEEGRLGKFLGYTEETVREQVVSILKSLDRRMILVEKLHPSLGSVSASIEGHGQLTIVRTGNVNLWHLLWHSAAVIGMRSMALLESAIFARPTVSFQPGLIGPQQCSALRLGLIRGVSSPQGLTMWCREQLEDAISNRSGMGVKRFPFARKDAAENVVTLAIGHKEERH